MKFVVSQVGPNTFQATFYDSKGNIASLLPDRTLTYEIGGQKYTMTLSGGTGVFKVDAANGDLRFHVSVRNLMSLLLTQMFATQRIACGKAAGQTEIQSEAEESCYLA